MFRRSLSYFLGTLALLPSAVSAQTDTAFTFHIDTYTPALQDVFTFGNMCADYDIDPNPDAEDSATYTKYLHLLKQKPGKENYREFYAFACAAWQLGHNTEAREKFLQMVDCRESFYTGNYYNNSDIPGDTSHNIYGYGSYVGNYKNYACRYLTKIYLQEGKPDAALKYISLADKVYIVTHNCGTGHSWYRKEIDGLYGLCYLGLEMYDSIFHLFMPRYSEFYSGTLVRAIQKVYTREQIQEQLQMALKSIHFVADTFQSSYYTTYNYGKENESTTETRYTSGEATMLLFGTRVSMPIPLLSEGEKVSKELLASEFQKSGFYRALIL